jgi:predicted Co/Zn/Cd cation transporter (cation efflux family)
MDYFELKYDADNYSKAYKQYRKEWVEEHIAAIIVVLLAIFLIPMAVGKVKSIRREIEIDEIRRKA